MLCTEQDVYGYVIFIAYNDTVNLSLLSNSIFTLITGAVIVYIGNIFNLLDKLQLVVLMYVQCVVF